MTTSTKAVGACVMVTFTAENQTLCIIAAGVVWIVETAAAAFDCCANSSAASTLILAAVTLRVASTALVKIERRAVLKPSESKVETSPARTKVAFT